MQLVAGNLLPVWTGLKTDRVSHDAQERAHEQYPELKPAARRKRMIYTFILSQ